MIKDKNGFTLFEILIVIGIMGFIILIGANTFLSIIKSTNKTNALSEVKQNGNYALGVMEMMIRNSSSFTFTDATSVTVVSPSDQAWSTFECGDFDGDPLDSEIASISAIRTSLLISNQLGVVDCNIFTRVAGTPGQIPEQVQINFTLAKTGGNLSEKAESSFNATITRRNF